jgi:hypothetical protein
MTPEPTMDKQLAALIRAQPWVITLLGAVRDEQLPDGWIGAGLLRDLVWGERFGSGFNPDEVRDVDVTFFDLTRLDRAYDDEVTERLRQRLPGVPWEAKNQARVHTWYPAAFGVGSVPPLTSIREAVTSCPETATAVAVRLTADAAIEICAPHGLNDLLGGVWRRNPHRITIAQSLVRLARHDPAVRWPHVTVVPPA